METAEKLLKTHQNLVIDTNVILTDPRVVSSLHKKFPDKKIIIPITVFRELNKFKDGTKLINYNARVFMRYVDALFTNTNQDWLILGGGYNEPKELLNDDKIIQVAKQSKALIITSDIIMRAIARSSNIPVVDYVTYLTDEKPLERYSGYREIIIDNEEFFNDLFKHKEIKNIKKKLPELFNSIKPIENEYFIFKNGQSTSAITKYRNNTLYLVDTSKTLFGIKPKNLEQHILADLLTDPKIPLVAVTGVPGSGKTLLSVAAALETKRSYKKILITRSIVDVEKKDLGALPGEKQDKVSPYMQPFYDNLDVISSVKSDNKTKINKYIEEEKIKIEVINYIRGRSLPKIYMIIDETQNTTVHSIKTLITRIGEGSKVILLGDLNQIDTLYLDKYNNGLAHVIRKFKGDRLFGYVNLKKSERSKLAERADKLL